MPRAVGYSAGLINYFFRGKMDFVADPNNVGKYLIKNLGPEQMKGTFTLYYDDKDGNRYAVPGAQWELTIPHEENAQGLRNESESLSFTPPSNPAPKSANDYMLVFKGTMGEEAPENSSTGAVVAKK